MNFLEAQKEAMAILRAIGCVSFTLDSTGRAKTSFPSVAYSFVIISALFYFYFAYAFNPREDQNYINSGTLLMTFALKIQGLVLELSYMIILSSICFFRRSQLAFINELLELEEEIEAISHVRTNYNDKLRTSSVKFVIINAIVNVIFFLLCAWLLPKNSYSMLLLDNTCFFFYLLYLSFIAHFIENLVKTLGSLFDELNWKIEHVVSCPFHAEGDEIKSIFRLHDQVVSSIRAFNGSFGIIVMAVGTFVFGSISSDFLIVFETIFCSDVDVNMREAVISSVSMLCLFPLFFILSKVGFTCTSVKEKVCSTFSSCEGVK